MASTSWSFPARSVVLRSILNNNTQRTPAPGSIHLRLIKNFSKSLRPSPASPSLLSAIAFVRHPVIRCTTAATLFKTTLNLRQTSRHAAVARHATNPSSTPGKLPPDDAPPPHGPGPSSRPPRRPSPLRDPYSLSIPDYARYLLNRDAPTVLYQAPSHSWLLATYWGVASVFVLLPTSWYVMFKTYPLPIDAALAWWVSRAYELAIIVCTAVGGVMVMAASDIVKSVATAPRGPTSPGAVELRSQPPLKLRVEVKRVLPLLRPRIYEVPFSQVMLESGTLEPVLSLTPAQLEEMARKQAAVVEAQRKLDRRHRLTLPARKLWRLVTNSFRLFNQAVSRQGFATLWAGPKKLRFHVTEGWFLDNGKALDKLISGNERRPRYSRQ